MFASLTRKSFTTSVLPLSDARCRGFDFLNPHDWLLKIFWTFSKSFWSTSLFAIEVSILSKFSMGNKAIASISAPFSSKYFATSCWPLNEARCNAIKSFAVLALTLTPDWRRRSTILSCPFQAAQWSAVQPSSEFKNSLNWFTLRRISTTPMSPIKQAKCRKCLFCAKIFSRSIEAPFPKR